MSRGDGALGSTGLRITRSPDIPRRVAALEHRGQHLPARLLAQDRNGQVHPRALEDQLIERNFRVGDARADLARRAEGWRDEVGRAAEEVCAVARATDCGVELGERKPLLISSGTWPSNRRTRSSTSARRTRFSSWSSSGALAMPRRSATPLTMNSERRKWGESWASRTMHGIVPCAREGD